MLHKIVPIIMESFGAGPLAGRGPAPLTPLLFRHELARALTARAWAKTSSPRRGAACARSFKCLHAMRITIALHCAAAEEMKSCRNRPTGRGRRQRLRQAAERVTCDLLTYLLACTCYLLVLVTCGL